MNLRDFANKINNIKPRDIMNNISNSLSEEFVRLNKEQLMEGKSSLGVDMSPSYLNDPFFKTYLAAKTYRDWKQRITPNPNRNPDAPNLYITGQFHSGFFMNRQGEEFVIDSNDKNTDDIESTFKHVFGLSPKNIEIEKNKILKMSWKEIINLLLN